MGISSLIYPEAWLDDDDDAHGFYHLAVETMFLGLIDDVYINWRPYDPNSTTNNITIVEVHSQPRLGKNDFDSRNYDNLLEFYECMHYVAYTDLYEPRPCQS